MYDKPYTATRKKKKVLHFLFLVVYLHYFDCDT